MLKRILIATATAVALTGAAVATTTPAAAAPAGYADISWKGGWNGQNQWKGHGNWQGHGGYKNWNPRRACRPIIRWKKVGYRYHRRWQPIVVGWNCGHGGHKGHNGHKNWKWN